MVAGKRRLARLFLLLCQESAESTRDREERRSQQRWTHLLTFALSRTAERFLLQNIKTQLPGGLCGRCQILNLIHMDASAILVQSYQPPDQIGKEQLGDCSVGQGTWCLLWSH